MQNPEEITIKNVHFRNEPLDGHVLNSVEKFYNQFPYPNYSFLAKPNPIHSYFASSIFCQKLHLFNNQSEIENQNIVSSPRILVAGCGDSQPLLVNELEPNSSKLTFCDISQKSLSRAKMRLKVHNPLGKRKYEFVHSDITSHQFNKKFHHIDVIGVIHHCENPSAVLKNLSSHLVAGGTLRMMVYNPFSRDFIGKISRYFQKRGLTSNDSRQIRQEISLISQSSSTIREKLSGMHSILQSNSRIADTFFHPHNVLASFQDWILWSQQAGLNYLGLFDRYGELDDLPSPLHGFLDIESIHDRCLDKRFENNFELYFTKGRKAINILPSRSLSSRVTKNNLPKFLGQFREFASLDRKERANLINFLWNPRNSHSNILSKIDEFPTKMQKRLVRLGIVFPFESLPKNRFLGPIEDEMEIPPKTQYPEFMA